MLNEYNITEDQFKNFTDTELVEYLEIVDKDSCNITINNKVPSDIKRDYYLARLLKVLTIKRILNLKLMSIEEIMKITGQTNNGKVKPSFKLNDYNDWKGLYGLREEAMCSTIMTIMKIQESEAVKIERLVTANPDFDFAPLMTNYNHELNTKLVMSYRFDENEELPENADLQIERYCMYEALKTDRSLTGINSEVSNKILDNTIEDEKKRKNC